MKVKQTKKKYQRKNKSRQTAKPPQSSRPILALHVLMMLLGALGYLWPQTMPLVLIALPVALMLCIVILLVKEETFCSKTGLWAILLPALLVLLSSKGGTSVDGGWNLLKISLVLAGLLLVPLLISEYRVPKKKAGESFWGRALALVIFLVMLCFAWLNASNVVFDTSEPTVQRMTVVSVQKQHHSKGGNSYYAHTRDEMGEEIRLRIRKKDYQQMQKGDELLVSTHEGFWQFGYYTWAYPEEEKP